MSITVVLADDQPLIRAGFAALLNSDPDIGVVREAADGPQAVAQDTQPAELLRSIRVAADGHALPSPEVTTTLIEEYVSRPPTPVARATRHLAHDGEDSREPDDTEASRPPPRAARHVRLRGRRGGPAREVAAAMFHVKRDGDRHDAATVGAGSGIDGSAMFHVKRRGGGEVAAALDGVDSGASLARPSMFHVKR